jgi:ribosomal protein S18 acetylase RimI-like enzyme
MSARIRTFVMDDYDAVRTLWARFPGAIGVGRSDTREEIEKKLSRDPDLFLVAEDSGKIVGTVIGGYDGRRGLIYHLAADPAPAHCGLGSLLMAEVERRLAAKGCLRAYLLVLPENVRLLDYYAHLGWEAMRITTMAKDLGACAPLRGAGRPEGANRSDPC